MREPRSNFLAGVLTIAAIGAFACAVWAMNAWKQARMIDYKVHFTAEQGVYGLHEGSKVRVGGMVRGHVESVAPDLVDGQVTGYTVAVAVDAEVPIYSAAHVEAVGDGVSGDSMVDFLDTGRRAPIRGAAAQVDDPGILPRGSDIPAKDPSAYRAFVGGAGEKPVKALVDAWFPEGPEAESLAGRLEAIFNGMPKLTAGIREDGRALKDGLGKDIKAWTADYEAARDAAVRAFTKLGAGKDPPGDAVVPQLKAAAADFDSMPRLDHGRAEIASSALDQAVESIKSMSRKVKGMRDMLDDPDSSVDEASADFSIASQEISATWTEALLQPWRLVGSPDAGQARERNRAELARVFAQAAVQHQRALKGIEDALRRDAKLLETDPALVALLRSRLDASIAVFDAWRRPMEELLLGPQSAPAKP